MEEEIEIIKQLINDLKREEKLIGYDAEVEIKALENLIKEYKDLHLAYELYKSKCEKLEEENKKLKKNRWNITIL